ncbi:hypothetical protein NDS46_31830 (plasmid) [Paenibacillus thiaminolyticus]|uniref:hypothetical protein n=1 Tax=Paenibacillus thiaminolyticus TaxID=49283 RepID=UPI00233085C5|nr:hypothetical protein [Paenibacillus thiaminolyticus]WCF11549.1 hypothetical protein NDS46_31830 [Paenibacillus thiaminolyticus]
MEIIKNNGFFVVEVEGDASTLQDIPSSQRTFKSKPELIRKWMKMVDVLDGWEEELFAEFKSGEERFYISLYYFYFNNSSAYQRRVETFIDNPDKPPRADGYWILEDEGWKEVFPNDYDLKYTWGMLGEF